MSGYFVIGHPTCDFHLNNITEILCTHLLVGQGVHVAYDLGSHLACLGRSTQERALHHGHDKGERRRVDEVDKLSLQEALQAARRLLRRVLQRSEQYRHNRCIDIVIVKILFMAPRMVYCSIINLLCSLMSKMSTTFRSVQVHV